MVFGGEALDPARLASWCERHEGGAPKLVNMYDITETTVLVTYGPLDSSGADATDVGSPIGRGTPRPRRVVGGTGRGIWWAGGLMGSCGCVAGG